MAKLNIHKEHGWDITYFDLGRRGPWGSTWHVLRGWNTCNRKM
jgi:hypothetical protein